MTVATDALELDKEFYLQTIAHITHIPLMLIRADGSCELSFSGWREDTNPLIEDKAFSQQLFTLAQEKKASLFCDFFSIYFAVCKWSEECAVILGPFSESEASPSVVRAFSIKHQVRLRPISLCPNYVVCSCLEQMYYLRTGQRLSLSDLLDSAVVKKDLHVQLDQQIMKVMIRQFESIVPHNDGSWEIIRRKSIMNGDLEALQKHRDAPFAGKRGVIGPTPLRNAKNLAIVDVTVTSRAALDAGLDSETVYCISDGYFLQIEQAQTEMEADAIAHIAAEEFTKLVKKLREGSYHVNENTSEYFIKARDFIIRHIYEKLLVEDIASEVGISADYLETLFHRELSLTVNDFIINQKIERAVLLMHNPKLSLDGIITMLGYSSKSNFTAQFKKRKNMTPGRYRRYLLNEYLCVPEIKEQSEDAAPADT